MSWPSEELNAALNPRGVPYYEAVAKTGEGVLKTFTAISKLVLQDMQKFPERHNFTIGDILGKGDKQAVASALRRTQRAGTRSPPCPGRPWQMPSPKWPRSNRQ